MVWSVPATYTSGETLTGAKLNLVRDNLLSARNGFDQYVKVYLDNNQIIPNNTDTTLTWNTVEWQVGSLWSAGSPTLFTAPVAGKYLLVVNIEWRSNTNNFRNVTMLKGGNVWALKAVGSSGGKSNLSASRIFALTAAETFVIRVYQNSGGALTVHGGAKDRTRAALMLLGT